MIKVKLSKDHIEIKGHAMFADSGKDIVCASASSIIITSINGILSLDDKALIYKKEDGFLSIDILKHNEQIDALILNMKNLLKELENQYKQNIKIEEV